MASIIYERDGIYIEYSPLGAKFKKNGLTIEIPAYILEDFEVKFEQAKLDYIRQVNGERSEP